MTDWGLAYILLAIGYVGISAIIASLMIFIEQTIKIFALLCLLFLECEIF